MLVSPISAALGPAQSPEQQAGPSPLPPPVASHAPPGPPPRDAVNPARPTPPVPSPIPGRPTVDASERLVAMSILDRSPEVQAVLNGRAFTISNVIPWTSSATGAQLGVAFEIKFSTPQSLPASTSWLRMSYRRGDASSRPFSSQRYTAQAARVHGVFVTVHLPTASLASLDPAGPNVALSGGSRSEPSGR